MKKLLIITIILIPSLIYFFIFLKQSKAQVCLPLTGYIVWPGIWEPGRIPMASSSQYYLTGSPLYVSGGNVGIGITNPAYKLQVNGYISGTKLCIQSDCRDVWPGGGVAGTGMAGQVAFWTNTSTISGDNNLFWDNINKRLGIGTTTPQTSLYVVGNITANEFLGKISAANVSSGQFGSNTEGGNYIFMGNVGIGTTSPDALLHLSDLASSPSSRAMLKIIRPNNLAGGGTPQQAGLYIKTHDYPLHIENYAGTPALTINSSANVGIGTTTPAYKLDVVGQINASGGLCIAGDCKTAWSQVGGGGYWAASGTNIYNTNSGNVGIGTTNPLAKLSVGGSGPTTGIGVYASSTDYGVYSESSNYGVYGRGYRGVYGVGNNASLSYGVYGYGPYGVYGEGYGTSNPIGVYGSGTYGVYGTGSSYGVFGTSSTYYGVYGESYGSTGTGVKGKGFYGVVAEGSQYGVYASAPNGFAIYSGSGINYFAYNVGIGTSTPVYKLDVVGDIRTTGCLVYNGGTLGTCASDINLKNIIGPFKVENALDKIIKLNPVKYTLKKDPSGQVLVGLIAQEVEQFAPEFVTTTNKEKQIKYGEIQWLQIEAIKEQQKEIKNLEERIKNLEERIKNLQRTRIE